MEGSLHAFALLLVIFLSAGICYKYGKRDDQLWQELYRQHFRTSITPLPRLAPAWHTPLTHLYRITDDMIAVWYPGGPLREGMKRLEWRPYPG
jgi:hypothetical protein